MYPQHFDLEQVTLLDSPFKTALDVNNALLLRYDVDRLLTPFVRQAGLANTTKTTSRYYGWTTKHPSFGNWGTPDWTLEGHVGGHYVTALALAVAATHDDAMKAQLKERLDYCVTVLKDCQDAYDTNKSGLYGFIGGQPFNNIWTSLYAGDTAPFKDKGGMVPFYCQHKVLAGLRDAWIYGGNETARELFQKMCDWSVNVVSNLTDAQLQDVLGWEHGGMNEPLADAYVLFGDIRYLNAAKRYSHQYMVSGMSSLNTTFLDGKHANTQVPKYIGFERVYQALASGNSGYRSAAHNFWQDVAQNRTVCIGGNSVSEHFLPKSRASQYIDNLEGPESCNSNNMLKLSENLFDETHNAQYADFYENTMLNHILSTQDPNTGGYVYFTTLRPQGYRIYSQVNQGMWCCVGTGMENHSKYGHFAYTHSADNKTLYVNLFIASSLDDERFSLTQQTKFPYENATTITIDRDGDYTLALRHPAWAGSGYAVSVNGEPVSLSVKQGTASYASVSRMWKKGDVVTVTLPMELSVEPCPGLPEYVAFKYGPVLLAAQTTATSLAESRLTGLAYESLQNEYAREGRMDHSPGAVGKSLPLSNAPLLIGNPSEVLNRIRPFDSTQGDVSTAPTASSKGIAFTIDASSTQSKGNWSKLTLVPFYAIHHARYQCYWYCGTEADYAKSDMGKADALAAELEERTLDYVATGEQQSEAGHSAKYSGDSGRGSYNGEFYRDAQAGGWMQYTLATGGETERVSLMVRFTTADRNRVGTIYIDGTKLTELTIPSSHPAADGNGFYSQEISLPASMLVKADGTPKSQIVFRFVASGTTPIPGLYYLRLLRGREYTDPYQFVASEWVTGDAGRVAQSSIVYNKTKNYLAVSASGANNVCLKLAAPAGTVYNVPLSSRYLVVKGTNLSTAAGASYLWWLNGCNRGSSVAPCYTGTAADGQTLIVWDVQASGIADNCATDPWDACFGQTIFGLTATSGAARIYDISFVDDIDAYSQATSVTSVQAQRPGTAAYYTLQGVRVAAPQSRGVTIVRSADGKHTKVLRK